MLFMIADDMRPQLGCYGMKMMKTPNLDKLASTGTLFNRQGIRAVRVLRPVEEQLHERAAPGCDPSLELLSKLPA